MAPGFVVALAVGSGMLPCPSRLDALNRDRFLDDRELLTAWASARNVLGPFRSRNGNGTGNGTGSPDAGVTPGPTPPSGTNGDVQASA